MPRVLPKLHTFSKDGVYNLFRELREFLIKPTPGKYKKFLKEDFYYFTQYYYSNTKHWSYGADKFVELSNALNSGEVSLIEAVAAYIGKFILKHKPITYNDINNIDNIKNFSKFYTIDETKKHFQYIKKLEEDEEEVPDTFFESTKNKIDVYKVNAVQQNRLYELIKEGKVNFFCFIFALEKGKFKIDEKKITDPEYKLFIQCINIVRRNITIK